MSDEEKVRDPSGISKFFGELANKTSLAAGRASAFIVAAGIVIVWAVSGPIFGFSDTWQLVINTGNDHRHVPDGVSHSELAEPRQRGDTG